MMGEPAVRFALLFYLIHLLIWVRLVSDLCLNFIDKVLKNHDINSNKIAKKNSKNTCKQQAYNQQRIN